MLKYIKLIIKSYISLIVHNYPKQKHVIRVKIITNYNLLNLRSNPVENTETHNKMPISMLEKPTPSPLSPDSSFVDLVGISTEAKECSPRWINLRAGGDELINAGYKYERQSALW